VAELDHREVAERARFLANRHPPNEKSGLIVVFGGWLSFGQSGPDQAWTRLLALAATGSLVGWAGCIFFSNLWIFPGLWVVPGMSAVLIVSLAVGFRPGRAVCAGQRRSWRARAICGADGVERPRRRGSGGHRGGGSVPSRPQVRSPSWTP
jgi:hypothetical protein